MPVGQCSRLFGAPFDNRLVQRAVLTDQHVARLVALGVHPADIGHHVALEQVEQTANGVQ
ncbi:hypothetical protein D3C85_1867870 [compost metagenome]